MHKSCIFKFCCTFAIVLIQILCDKNYKYCENQNDNCDLETDLSDETSNDQDLKSNKKIKNRKRPTENKPKQKLEQSNSLEEKSYNLHVFEQPHSLNPFIPSHQCQPCNPSSISQIQSSYPYNSNDAQITIDPSYRHNPNSKVSFNNHLSTSQFSPSFNIPSHKKSTPIQQTNTPKKRFQSAQTPNISNATQNQTVVTIENNSNLKNDEIECDETLC